MGFFSWFHMPPVRVTAFVDGFNLYHAIHDLGENHLKWLDLWKLCVNFAPGPDFELRNVYYFSAYATWRKDSYERHRAYVKALQTVGVVPVMARFKERERRCRLCKGRWTGHEEKETDVNIALRLVTDATRNRYDRALLVSGDSDLVPAVRILRSEFPAKQVRIITPVGRKHSYDLLHAVGGKRYCRYMKRIHVERSLFPGEVLDAGGATVVIRPPEYDPP